MSSQPSIHLIYYLSGPMTGIKNFNSDNFKSACLHLRATGLTVLSPDEIDFNETKEDRGKKDYGFYMKESIKLLLQADAIILMDGWQDSRGCRTELNVARAMNYPVYRYHQSEVNYLDPTSLSLKE